MTEQDVFRVLQNTWTTHIQSDILIRSNIPTTRRQLSHVHRIRSACLVRHLSVSVVQCRVSVTIYVEIRDRDIAANLSRHILASSLY